MGWLGGQQKELKVEQVPAAQDSAAGPRGTLRTAHYGLGEVGRQVVALLARRQDVRIVAALDADPLKAGKDIGEIAGLGYKLGVSVSSDPGLLPGGVEADVVVHATSPHLSVALPQILPLLASGKSVVSGCNELVYPWLSRPDMASTLDAAAKKAGSALLGVGVSPGFVTDFLPLLLASACAQAEAISVTRVVELAKEPAAVRGRAGLGMTLDAFRDGADDGAAALPALLDSVALMAAGLGWRLDRLVETVEPILAERRWESEATIVERGRVAGLRQLARGYRSDAEVLSVELLAVLGAPDPHDAIVIRGQPPISARIEGGIPSHLATASLMVHALPAVAAAPPGLLSVTDLLGTYSGRAGAPVSQSP